MGTEAAQGRERLEVALDSRLPELLAEVRDLLADGMPEYAAFLDHNPHGMREAAELFIHRLLDMAEHGRSVSRDDHLEGAQTIQLVFEQIGRRQWQAGEDLTRLLTAYQLGARTAWRHVSATALALEVRPDVLAALAEAVFDFINQLSSASARGYVLEQREDASARERSREELAELLLSDRSGMNAIREAAARANWPLPATGAVVLVDATTEVARRVLSHVDAGSLPVRHEQLSGAIVPDPGPSSRRDQLRRALRGPTRWSATPCRWSTCRGASRSRRSPYGSSSRAFSPTTRCSSMSTSTRSSSIATSGWWASCAINCSRRSTICRPEPGHG